MTYDDPLLVITGKTHPCPNVFTGDLKPLDAVQLFYSDNIKSNTKECSSNKFPTSSGNADEWNHLLRPYTITSAWRKLPVAICINNEMVSRYKAPKITEYLDLNTGEIIQAVSLRNNPRVPAQIHVGEIQLLRQSLMNSLRKEVREFAVFVLMFRNNRRGVTPDIGTLVEWYASLHDKRPSNIRRYVAALQSKGFFAGESLLSPLFQRTGKAATTKDHLGEDVAARGIMLKMRMRKKSNLP